MACEELDRPTEKLPSASNFHELHLLQKLHHLEETRTGARFDHEHDRDHVIDTYASIPCLSCAQVDEEAGLVCETCDRVQHVKCMSTCPRASPASRTRRVRLSLRASPLERTAPRRVSGEDSPRVSQASMLLVTPLSPPPLCVRGVLVDLWRLRRRHDVVRRRRRTCM